MVALPAWRTRLLWWPRQKPSRTCQVEKDWLHLADSATGELITSGCRLSVCRPFFRHCFTSLNDVYDPYFDVLSARGGAVSRGRRLPAALHHHACCHAENARTLDRCGCGHCAGRDQPVSGGGTHTVRHGALRCARRIRICARAAPRPRGSHNCVPVARSTLFAGANLCITSGMPFESQPA